MEKSRLRNVKDNALLENRTGPTSEYLQNQQGIKAKTNMLTTGKRSLLPLLPDAGGEEMRHISCTHVSTKQNNTRLH